MAQKHMVELATENRAENRNSGKMLVKIDNLSFKSESSLADAKYGKATRTKSQQIRLQKLTVEDCQTAIIKCINYFDKKNRRFFGLAKANELKRLVKEAESVWFLRFVQNGGFNADSALSALVNKVNSKRYQKEKNGK